MHPLSACPVCGSCTVEAILTLRNVPIHCNVLCSSREEALDTPKADIDLVYCARCSHAFNRAFDPERLVYSGHYENSLFFSPTFQAYAQTSARRLMERYDLRNKTIVEIGSGDGQFLKLLCELGENRGVAFDPSAASVNGAADPRITVIRDYYSEKYSNVTYRGDLICCRQVLEHLWKPGHFLQSLRRTLQDDSPIPVFFEVPNATNMFEEGRVWDVIYEHYSYFNARSLSWAFVTSGFRVTHVEETFGGQYLCLEALPAQSGDCAVEDSNPTPPSFGRAIQEMVRRWRERLQEWKASGKRIALWGAGSKGVTFLNMLDSAGVECVVDVNPRKHGKFVAGAGHEIKSPQVLGGQPCDVVLIANELYRSEIVKTLHELKAPAEVLCL